MPRNPAAEAHLAHQLYARLVAGPHNLPTVARRASMSAELLYKLCRGERALLAWQIPAIYRGTQDLELYAELAGATDCGLVVCEAPRSSAPAAGDSRIAALHVGASAGRVQQLVVDAEADGVVTEQERAELERELNEHERRAEELRQVLRRRSGR